MLTAKEQKMSLAITSYRFINQLSSAIAPSWTAKRALMKFLTPKRFEPKPWEIEGESTGERFNINCEISGICWRPDNSVNPGEQKNQEQKVQEQPIQDHTEEKLALLAHGWESRASQMYVLVPLLLDLNYKVIAIDMPAHGHSKGKYSDADRFTETIVLAQKEFGKFDLIIGHSMGAGAACLSLSRGVTTDKLVLISSPSSVERVILRFTRFIGLNKVAINHFFDYCTDFVGTPPSELDSNELLSVLNVPALLIHDQNDIEIPLYESERLKQVFSKAELFVTEGLGHRRILKANQVKKKIANFLS